jgi:hypothetical protein
MLKDLLKIAAVGAVIYGAYKLGEKKGKENSYIPFEPNPEPIVVEPICDEEKYVIMLIDELKKKPNKTQKDKDNLSLLQVKLEQLKRQKK